MDERLAVHGIAILWRRPWSLLLVVFGLALEIADDPG
jgi:hypothetical protein